MSDGIVSMSRTFTLATPAGEASLARLRSAEGITAVRGEAGARRIEVAFDLACLDGADVVSILERSGLALADGFLARLSRRWSDFRENNLRDQSKIKRRCCGNWSEGG